MALVNYTDHESMDVDTGKTSKKGNKVSVVIKCIYAQLDHAKIICTSRNKRTLTVLLR